MDYKIRSAVLPIIVVNVAVFMLQIFLGSVFTESFMLISSDILSRPWIIITSMFLHASFNHIFYNMYGLFLFGAVLEQRIGPKRFLFVYFLSGVFAAILSSFFYERALGASGAIMGVIGALIVLMPELRLLFLFIVPMPLWFAGIIYALIDLFGVFFPSGVGNIAHLAGMGLGLLYGLYLKKQKKDLTGNFPKKSILNL